jgi:hypothetical protein
VRLVLGPRRPPRTIIVTEFAGVVEAIGRLLARHRQVYPLEQIVEAYRDLETGQKVGIVVISLEPST